MDFRQRAALCARCAELAYERSNTVALIVKNTTLPFTAVEMIDDEKSDTQVYLFSGPEFAVVSIRGTQVTENWSWKDVRRNLQIGQVRAFHGIRGMVHRGYYNAWVNVREPVNAFIASEAAAGKFVMVTGHSMGAVIMNYCAAENPGVEAHSFGSPRAGDRAFAWQVAHVNRWVYDADVATSWPLPGRYQHGGIRWQITTSGHHYHGGHWRDMVPFAFPPSRGVRAHRVENYRGKL